MPEQDRAATEKKIQARKHLSTPIKNLIVGP